MNQRLWQVSRKRSLSSIAKLRHSPPRSPRSSLSIPLWAELDKTIRSVKGLADRTVAILLADLPEIGTLSNKAITKLVGLAPLANDSGKRTGQRSIRGGRAAVRSILFLVADIARKYDADLTSFRDRLIAQGKAKMVVRIALARKLLVRLNAKARDARLNLAHAD